MTEKELRKLNRAELLELLLELSRENEALQAQLKQTEAALSDRRLQMEEAGSIAEAALRLNGIFEAAQKAADQYLSSVSERTARQEEICIRMEAETKRKCDEMVERARLDSQRYWDEISRRMEDFYNAHAGLRELLAVGNEARQKVTQ